MNLASEWLAVAPGGTGPIFTPPTTGGSASAGAAGASGPAGASTSIGVWPIVIGVAVAGLGIVLLRKG